MNKQSVNTTKSQDKLRIVQLLSVYGQEQISNNFAFRTTCSTQPMSYTRLCPTLLLVLSV